MLELQLETELQNLVVFRTRGYERLIKPTKAAVDCVKALKVLHMRI